MIYDLPKTVTVGGRDFEVCSDFRDILGLMEILNDMGLKDWERGFLTLLYFYPEFESLPATDYQEALEKCFWFINGGQDEKTGGPKPRLMDWEQDFPYIIAPVNRVIGHEIRADAYLHWWTFLAAYMEIGECTFAQIIHIRDQKNRGKPLDKSDRDWYARNRQLVDMKQKFTTEEEETLKRWGGG